MSHTIYNTEAFIMSSHNSGEADRVYKLFTKDLGVITAKATGIRKIESRLNFFVQDFKYIDASLVKGKTIWRLVSARPIHELNSKKVFQLHQELEAYNSFKSLLPKKNH